MKRSKKVNVTCFTPHWKYDDLSVGWNDVWISYYKGKKRIKESLTFIWAGDIDNQIKAQEEANEHMRSIVRKQKRTPITVTHKGSEETYASVEDFFGFDEMTLEEHLDLYKDENTDWLDLQWMKEYFQEYDQGFGIMNCSNDTQGGFQEMDGDFLIMVNRPTLCRKDFEDGLDWYLKTIQNVGKVQLNFNWKRMKTWVFPA